MNSPFEGIQLWDPSCISESHLKIYLEICKEKLWPDRKPFVEEIALAYLSKFLQKDNQQVGYEELWAFSEQESTHRAQLQAFWKYHGGNTIK